MVITIPCTRLTKCILSTEYGPGPIRISRTHLLWPLLRPHAPGDRIGKSHVVQRRSATFEIEAPRQLAELILLHASDAGVALHRHHVDMMLRYTFTVGAPYRTSLREFLDLYRITDDDYDLDSAYRIWQRFYKDFTKSLQKHCAYYPKTVTRGRKPGFLQKPADDDLQKLVRFVLRRLRYLRPQLPRYVFRQTELYLHVDYGRRSTAETAERFGRPQRTVQHSVKQIRGYVEVDEDFARLVAPDLLFT